ncbi:MAG: gamma-glutamyl-gamma-aminobutyrate hydrolase family protein [Pseudomonadales bacterium]|nr:gamma-glutamyl-gamma-aminobutyrate hydrolase family protein [Pseudomonadales bacterium]
MRIHTLQHSAFEGLGSIEPHLGARGHTLSLTALYKDAALPAVANFDWLLVLGGPMRVHDTARHPWLVDELALIRAAIDANKRVLGICLGAQLIAKALGGEVKPNGCREIGWFPITREADATRSPVAAALPPTCDVFHWHSDTFTLPQGATLLASSMASGNQAFLYGERVVGLQFHLETTFETARCLIDHAGDELDGSRWVQSAAQLLGTPTRFATINKLMSQVLDAMAQVP